jgi:biopolymer transport protein ExbD
MAGNTRDNEEILADINVTPFVDVVLVLLLIFMISAPVLYKNAIHIQLPEAVTGQRVDHITLSLYVTKDGQILTDNRPVDLATLKGMIAQAKANDPNADVVVAADRQSTHDHLMKVIDLARAQGIQSVGLTVQTRR